jgi:hypothetical protein
MSEAPSAKGHWPKGKSRNLSPRLESQARTLIDLLRRAIDSGWRHQDHGALSNAKVAEILGEDRSTVHKWLTGKRLPPPRIVDALRQILKDYRP